MIQTQICKRHDLQMKCARAEALDSAGLCTRDNAYVRLSVLLHRVQSFYAATHPLPSQKELCAHDQFMVKHPFAMTTAASVPDLPDRG
jgi:hypothetical protein